MESIFAESSWRLVIRRGAAGITILQALTCQEQAVLPSHLFGLPVVELAPRALAAGRAAPVGEEVLLQWGNPSGEWDNRTLRELTLPHTLRRIGDYAFLNCAKLKKLTLHDSAAFWGGSCFMNCRELSRFHIYRTGKEQGESLAYIADELSCELDVTLEEAEGELMRLLFPEFIELFEENVPNHHFDYTIYGAGYPYHRCFVHKKFQVADYDLLWPKFLATEHRADTAVRLAYWRLRYPAGLAEKCGADYRAYLAAHAGEMMDLLLAEGDADGAAFLLRTVEMEKDELSAACDLARRLGASQILALLLEEQHRRFPVGRSRSFDL